MAGAGPFVAHASLNWHAQPMLSMSCAEVSLVCHLVAHASLKVVYGSLKVSHAILR